MSESGSEFLEKDDSEVKWEVVASTRNSIELQVFVSILESENIPHIEKTSQVGSLIKVLAGFTIGEMSILVPEDRYDEARDLLSNRVELHDDYDVSGDADEGGQDYDIKK